MKRIVAAIVILFLIFGVCVSEALVTNRFEKKIYESVDLIKSARSAGDKDKCNMVIEDMKKTFEESENALSVFTDKSIVDDIERSVYRLSDYNYSEDNTIFMSELSVLETEIKELKRSSGLFYYSIF